MKEQTGSKYFTLLFPPEFRRASNLRLYTFIVLFFVLFTSAAENVEADDVALNVFSTKTWGLRDLNTFWTRKGPFLFFRVLIFFFNQSTPDIINELECSQDICTHEISHQYSVGEHTARVEVEKLVNNDNWKQYGQAKTSFFVSANLSSCNVMGPSRGAIQTLQPLYLHVDVFPDVVLTHPTKYHWLGLGIPGGIYTAAANISIPIQNPQVLAVQSIPMNSFSSAACNLSVIVQDPVIVLSVNMSVTGASLISGVQAISNRDHYSTNHTDKLVSSSHVRIPSTLITPILEEDLAMTVFLEQEVQIQCTATGSQPLFVFYFSDVNETVLAQNTCIVRHVFNQTGKFSVEVTGMNLVSSSNTSILTVRVIHRNPKVVVSAVAAPLVISISVALLVYSLHRYHQWFSRRPGVEVADHKFVQQSSQSSSLPQTNKRKYGTVHMFNI